MEYKKYILNITNMIKDKVFSKEFDVTYDNKNKVEIKRTSGQSMENAFVTFGKLFGKVKMKFTIKNSGYYNTFCFGILSTLCYPSKHFGQFENTGQKCGIYGIYTCRSDVNDYNIPEIR